MVQFTYGYTTAHILDCRVQSYQLASNGLVAPNRLMVLILSTWLLPNYSLMSTRLL
ncbi:hypothetical protein PROFUN_15991 [Planoprotostelium fungivorum]|uniref:Uncharacterized protein n=1 Tax=Planoprotostelium fungivorum TaxID=1890364 RepID=A0A2P6MTC4_9EUKA|nr:hypothetical protein PROFUN_15991 [Planoprotostelium fungivorum]